MDTFVQDLRHALRLLRNTPGFTFAAVTALALGIGANTAIFSVLNTVILKPLPYPDPERLVMFLNVSPQGSGGAASPTKFNVWRRQTGAFEDVSAYRFSVVNITGDANPEQVSAAYVSVDFFRLFGAAPILGRTFSQEEDRPAGGFTVVLGNGFWRRRFGGDPGVVGRTVLFNGQAHEIIGVLGPFDTTAIQSAVGAPEVWLPFQIDPNSTMQGNFFTTAGRLKPGVSVESGTAQLASAAAEFRQAFPQVLPPQVGFGVQTLQEMIVRNVRSSLWILLGAVSLVLLIACANVANLLLVRATVRQREIAIRAAIGAARGRIARQLMTESVVLSLLGGLVGLALGVLGIRALLALNPGNIPRIGIDGAAVGVDGRVLAFTAFVSVLTGLVFGLFPALRAARVDLSTVMKESAGRSGTGFKQNKTRAVLVITEIALALVLLVGAALLIRTYIALRAVDPGFNPQRVLTMRMSLTGDRFAKTAAIGQLMREGRERLEALPEVEAAAASCCVPLQGGFGLGFIIEGRPLEGPAHGGGSFTPISANYFNVFKIPVLRGRYFTEQDTTGAPGVVIINQAMARQYWPDGNPIGERLVIGRGLGPNMEQPPAEIVGVVGDVRDGALNRDPNPIMYIPWAQLPDAHSANLLSITSIAWVVRTRAEPFSLSDAIQKQLGEVSGGLPVARLRSMEDVVTQSTARADFNMLLLTIFAGSALALAAIGVYGLMAYSVQQRTQEMGVRLALGADASRVRNMVVRQGMTLVAVGVIIGIASAFGLAQVMATFLFGVTPRDPLVFVVVPFVLAIFAWLGVWLPARRAGRVDPVVALRVD
ncbi:MAG TPA: ABC transporter permease [Vicinamibacterales bacterium]|nr:ABC transporter permease [Vicinamibacterales bacterium]